MGPAGTGALAAANTAPRGVSEVVAEVVTEVVAEVVTEVVTEIVTEVVAEVVARAAAEPVAMAGLSWKGCRSRKLANMLAAVWVGESVVAVWEMPRPRP